MWIIALIVLGLVAYGVIASQQPKTFTCAKDGKAHEHNERTRKALKSGAESIYCDKHNRELWEQGQIKKKSGCLVFIFLLLIPAVALASALAGDTIA